MKKLLEYLLTSIVDDPDQVSVSQTKDDQGLITLNATVAASDMGKVIGRGGKVISAIRHILRIKSIKQDSRVTINLQEPV